MYLSEQLDALRAMSPRSRVRQLLQLGFEKSDWEELLASGEAATMEEMNGSQAAKMKRWNAVALFVTGYCGLARAFWALDFISEEHEAWCNRVNEEVEAGAGPWWEQRRFEEQYGILVGGHTNAEGWLRSMVIRVGERLDTMGE